MKRFTFRLESLRALREQAEEQAKLRLAHELAAEAAERERLVAAASRLSQARAQAGDEATSGEELAARQAFVERCERDVTSVAASLTLRRQAVQAAREALADAAHEREALERLRERKLAGHALEERRAEAVTLDEIGLAAFGRKVA
jgi:flagellar export protein FliJ